MILESVSEGTGKIIYALFTPYWSSAAELETSVHVQNMKKKMFKEYNSMKQSDEIKSTEYDNSGNNIIF